MRNWFMQQCLAPLGDDVENCEKFKLETIFQAAADWITLNL